MKKIIFPIIAVLILSSCYGLPKNQKAIKLVKFTEENKNDVIDITIKLKIDSS